MKPVKPETAEAPPAEQTGMQDGLAAIGQRAFSEADVSAFMTESAATVARVSVTVLGRPRETPGATTGHGGWTPGDALHVVRRDSADCQTGTPTLVADTRFSDVRLPQGTQAVVPLGSALPEFRPNGYTQSGLDTEIQVGPAGAPTTRITIRSFGPICAGPVLPVLPCP